MIIRTDNVDAFLNAENNLQPLKVDEEVERQNESDREPDPEWDDVNIVVGDVPLG